MATRIRIERDAVHCQHSVRKYSILLLFFVVSVTSRHGVLALPLVPVASSDALDSRSDESETVLTHDELFQPDKAEGRIGDESKESSTSESHVRDRDGKPTHGQCRVLSLEAAAGLLAAGSTSTSHDMKRFLADLGQRLSTRTVVLCKAVTATNATRDIATTQTPSRSTTDQNVSLAGMNQQPRLTQRLPRVLQQPASHSAADRNVWQVQEIPDITKYFASGDAARSGRIHRIRHHHRHHRARYRKHVGMSTHDYRQRSRRTVDDCKVDVERVAAIMKAFYCWDSSLARLTNQLRQTTESENMTSQLRCRLMRRYDNCRRNYIDKVFRTGHGLPISWPRQITDVMDRDDYSALYY